MTRSARRSPADLQAEAVASLLWMYLTLPEDVSRAELESFADAVISGIEAGDPELAVEQRLKAFQTTRLCQPVNILAITQLRKRIVQTVKVPARIGSAGRVGPSHAPMPLRRAG